MRTAYPLPTSPMLNGPTLSHTCLLPKPSLARRSTTPVRFSTPSSSISSKEWLRPAPASEGLRTPWKTVHHYYFRTWCIDGTWEKLHTPRYESVCAHDVSGETPSRARAHIVDSQSVKTTGVVGGERGYDSGKKVKGRKRHLLVDTQRVWCSKRRFRAGKCLMDREMG